MMLQKSIYGLVQAAFEWNKKATKILKTLGFIPCLSDPCLLIHPTLKVYIIIYVDDCLFVRKSDAIQDIIVKLQENLVIKCMGKITDYIGCNVDSTINVYKYTQPKLIQRMMTKYTAKTSLLKYQATHQCKAMTRFMLLRMIQTSLIKKDKRITSLALVCFYTLSNNRVPTS
jgi:Reverse transcriptase (RNA-dependent DNA polymerase)